MTKKKTIVTSILILLVSASITYLIFITAPEAERETVVRQTAMLVDVVAVNRGDYTPVVIATGAVQAARDVVLSTQVGGEVIDISSSFIPGFFVPMGETLLQINPADYENTLQLRKSD